MIPTPPAGSAALFILRQAVAQQPGNAHSAAGLASPVARPAEETDGSRFFGPNTMDITSMKVRLMERLGEAFGISMDDHPDARSFGHAIREVVEKLKMSPDGLKVLAKVEKDLGLDDLGISIDTLIGAIIDPTGDDAEKLDAALREQVGESIEDEREAETLQRLARMGLDDAGLYGI